MVSKCNEAAVLMNYGKKWNKIMNQFNGNIDKSEANHGIMAQLRMQEGLLILNNLWLAQKLSKIKWRKTRFFVNFENDLNFTQISIKLRQIWYFVALKNCVNGMEI